MHIGLNLLAQGSLKVKASIWESVLNESGIQRTAAHDLWKGYVIFLSPYLLICKMRVMEMNCTSSDYLDAEIR